MRSRESKASFPKLCLVLVILFNAARTGAATAAVDDFRSTKVVGGRLARRNEIPYIVSLHRDFGPEKGDMPFCGGSIYNKRFIITAAHCLDGDQAEESSLRIIAGTTDVTKLDEAQVIHVKKHIIHSKYSKPSYVNDIALLELEEELKFNNAVQPIPIAPAGVNSSGKATVSGWGATKAGKARTVEVLGSASKKLMTVDIFIIPRKVCDKYLDEIPQHTGKGVQRAAKTLMCAGDEDLPKGGKDSCFGDSGGPLMCSRKVDVGGDGKIEKYLCGVVSSGYGCALKLPGFYTEVAQFHDWIVKNAKS